MNSLNHPNIAAMGVINITPNSFSDGGQYNSIVGVQNKIQEMVQWGVTIFDIGAESTAPMNSPVGSPEELRRFEELLFPNLSFFPHGSTLSIDTFRVETFLFVYNKIKSTRFDLKVIWNDISGVLDDELWQTLELCPDALYVFCHNLAPVRELSASHMKYCLPQTDDVIRSIKDCFNDAVLQFTRRGLSSRLILDPCFGFSKTLEHNLTLLKHIDKIGEVLDQEFPMVIGISRKSFLKKSLPDVIDDGELLSSTMVQLEMLHASVLTQLYKRLSPRSLIVRLHHPSVFRASLWANCH